MKAITLEQRAHIYTLTQEGYSSHEIAFRKKISHSTVVRIKQRKEKTGSFDVIPKSTLIEKTRWKEWCWKDPKSPLRPQHVKLTVKFGGGSVMIWGCFGSFGVGNYCKIDGRMNENYID
nr:13469_t:CDS:2 [Entrophospora candida]